MKKTFIIGLIFCMSIATYAQILYEKGYYISNNGERTEGLIRNKNWSDYPLDFLYKSTAAGQSVLLGIDSVSEFGVYDKLRFVRKKVKIDRSSDLFKELGHNREPDFFEEQLFLRILVDGKHRLYEYQFNNVERYFIESDNYPIEQLVYKQFLAKDMVIGTNRDFQKQLWKYLSCESVSMQELAQLNYFRKDLISVVTRFNECDKADYINLGEKAKYDYFNLTFKAGSNLSAFKVIGHYTSTYTIDFDYKATFQFGMEAEYILPFNKHKWALTAEPGYLYYVAEGQNMVFKASIDYKSIELPVGVRYHMYLSEKSDVYVNAVIAFNYPLKLDIDYNFPLQVEMKSSSNLGFGIGYKYNRRFLAEFRAMIPRHMPGELISFWYSEYRSFSFLIGYTIF